MGNDMYFKEIVDKKQKEFAEKLTKLRTSKNMSSQELSLRSGMSHSYIHKMENNNFMPSIEALIRILDVLEYPFESFFVENSEKYKQDKEIAEAISHLSVEQKNALLQFIKTIKKTK